MKRSLLFCLAALLSAATWAYDFIEGGIYYNIVSEEDATVEVACENEYTDGTEIYTGDFTVPETVDHEGKTYTIVGLGDSAFSYCEITSISLPETLTYLEEYSFMGCVNLSAIDIPETVTRIGKAAFYECGIKSLVIPNGVETIEENFAQGAQIESLTIGEGITYIGRQAFHMCESLSQVTMLSKKLETIDYRAFRWDDLIEEFTLPASVTTLGEASFEHCEGLTKLYSLNPEPPTCGSNALSSIPKTCVLYVPEGSKDAYAADATWSYFTTIEEVAVEEGGDGALYTTDFTEWAELDGTTADGVDVTVATTTGGDLTFTLWGVSVVPGENESVSSSGTTNFKEDGALKFVKYDSEYSTCEPYFVTSTLGSISKIAFTEGVTGSDRGAKVSVKGDGDEDWVVLYEETMKAGTKDVEIDVDRTNCQLMFENLNLSQNVYIFDLSIWGTDAEETAGESGYVYEITPESGSKVTSISEVTVALNDPGINVRNLDASSVKVYKDGSSEPYASATAYYEMGTSVNYYAARIEFDFDTITEPGEYMIVIPEGSFYIAETGTWNDPQNEEIDIYYTIEGETTGIGSATIDAGGENVYYNLSGQRVASPRNGVYILNGKKVVVK